MIEKECVYCGTIYNAKTKRSMYCSSECRSSADKDNKRKVYRQEKGISTNGKCLVCGKEILDKRAGTKYCSDECRKKFWCVNTSEQKSDKTVKRIYVAKIEKECIVCGSKYLAKTTQSVYCSAECKNEHDKLEARKRWCNKKGIDFNVKKICPICGEEFETRKNGALDTYCSKECAHEKIKKDKREYAREHNNTTTERQHGAEKKCLYCGVKFISVNAIQKFCCLRHTEYYKYYNGMTLKEVEEQKQKRLIKIENKKIEKEIEQKQKILNKSIASLIKAIKKVSNKKEHDLKYAEKKCKCCGKIFKPKQITQVYCSDKCSKKSNVAKNNYHGRIKKRIKDESLIIDKNITVKRLFDRDKGVCHICGGKCDINDRRYGIGRDGRKVCICGDNYPSVDHVIPLAKMGKHSWDNVKLAHRICNTMKRDTML